MLLSRLLGLLGLAVLAACPAPAPAQQYRERIYDPDPAESEAKLAIMRSSDAFVSWVREQTAELDWKGRLDKAALCAKAREAIPEADRATLDLSLAIERHEVWLKKPGAILIDDVVSPYFLAMVVIEACDSAKLVFFEPRDPAFADPGEQTEVTASPDNCPAGPRLTIPFGMTALVPHLVNAFDELDSLSFICIGSSHGRLGHPPLMGQASAFRIKAKEVTFSNSRFMWPFFEGSTIGKLTLEGTIPPPVAGQTEPAAQGAQTFPGAIIEKFHVVGSEVETLTVRGVAIGELSIVNASIRELTRISRSEFGVLSIIGSRLKELVLLQLRIRAGGEMQAYENRAAGLHLTDNEVSGHVGLGAADESLAAMFSMAQRQPDMAELVRRNVSALIGPEPAWLAGRGWSSGGIEVRGYITLGQTRVGGNLLINGLDLADGEKDNGAFLNMNAVSAHRLTLQHSNIVLGQGRSVLGTDMKITEDVQLSQNLIRRVLTDEDAERYRPNRKAQSWRGEVVSSREAVPIAGFTGLSARDVKLSQNLIDEAFGLVNPKIRNLTIVTAPAEHDAHPLRGYHFCLADLTKGAGDLIESVRLQGGLRLGVNRLLPTSEVLFPTCYGSFILQGGTVEAFHIHALFSDLLVGGTHIARSLTLQGRAAGIVHLGNLQIKDGPLQLSTTGSPLRWCKDSELLLDGTRLWAIQADRDSFVRRDCEAEILPPDEARALGVVRMSMRGAHVDKITGSVRINLAQAADPGLFGLTTGELKEIAAPQLGQPPLSARLLSTLPSFLGGQPLPDRDGPRRGLDPATLAQFTKLLKENGYTSKSTDLTIERISRQKWESGEGLDRVKWLLGWPIGWGYQVEWGFGYALVFLFAGAWVSSYYRQNPDVGQPPVPPTVATWQRVVERRSRPRRARNWLAAALWSGTALGAVIAVMVWVPGWLPLSPDEALTATALALAAIVAMQLALDGRLARFWSGSQRRRFLAALPGVFSYHPWFFSLDRFLPAPGLHAYWANYPRIGQAGRNYFYFHRLMGLVLVSIVAAGFAGLFD